MSPLYALRLRTPQLELRLGSHEELVALGRLAREGIHPPDRTVFGVAWTDASGEPGFVDSVAEFHEGVLARWSADEWSLNLLVWANGELAGTQGVTGKDFARSRTVDTGSWLGERFQRRGYGTEMRAAVLELAFRGLGAEAATSGALAGNEASFRVSEKLGYRVTGTSAIEPRPGDVFDHRNLRLERAEWHPPVAVEIRNLEPALPLFGVA